MGCFNSLNLWRASQSDLAVISRTCDSEFCLPFKPQGAWVLLCAQAWYWGGQWLGLQSVEQVVHCLRSWCFCCCIYCKVRCTDCWCVSDHLCVYLYQMSVSASAGPGCGAPDVKLHVWIYVDGYITTRPLSCSSLQLSAQLPAVRELPNIFAVQQKLTITQKLSLHLHLTIQSVTLSCLF